MKNKLFLFAIMITLFSCGNANSSSIPSINSNITSDPIVENMSFGEKIIYNYVNRIKNNFETNLVNNRICIVDKDIRAYTTNNQYGGSVSNDDFEIVKSVTTDGDYIYALMNGYGDGGLSSSGYNVGIIVKIDTSGNLVKYSPYSYYWGTTGVKIGYFDGGLIVYNTIDGDVPYCYAASSFIGKTLFFDTDLNLIEKDYKLVSKLDSYPLDYSMIESFTTSPDGSKLAIVFTFVDAENNEKTRYIYKYEVNKYGNYQLLSNCQLPLLSMRGLSVTNDFIYINTYNEVDDSSSIIIYDWNNFKVGEVSSGYGIDYTNEKYYYGKTINGDDLEIYIYSYSISYGCVEINNQMFLIKGCWSNQSEPLSIQNPTKGLYLYSVDEKID